MGRGRDRDAGGRQAAAENSSGAGIWSGRISGSDSGERDADLRYSAVGRAIRNKEHRRGRGGFRPATAPMTNYGASNLALMDEVAVWDQALTTLPLRRQEAQTRMRLVVAPTRA